MDPYELKEELGLRKGRESVIARDITGHAE